MRLKQPKETRPPHDLHVHLDADADPDLQPCAELSRQQYGEAIATPALPSGNGTDVRDGPEARS